MQTTTAWARFLLRIPQNPAPQELVKSGTTEAQNRLKNEPCAKFFGGMEKGQKALNSLNFSTDCAIIRSQSHS
jgi:hypothetical protein